MYNFAHLPYDTDELAKMSTKQLLILLIETTFSGRPCLITDTKLLYEKPPPEDDEENPALDPELVDLLTEMAMTDQCNTGDVKQFRDDLTKKATQRLNAARQKERQRKAEALAKKKAAVKL